MTQTWKSEKRDGKRRAVAISREYDYPRPMVFGMFTDSKKAAKFWGIEGAVRRTFEIDPRPGGAIRIEEYDREGNGGRTTGTVLEVIVPELLVFRSATVMPGGTTPFEVEQTVRFEELGPSKTRVTASVKLLDLGSFPEGPEELEGGFKGGWGDALNLLQRELSSS